MLLFLLTFVCCGLTSYGIIFAVSRILEPIIKYSLIRPHWDYLNDIEEVKEIRKELSGFRDKDLTIEELLVWLQPLIGDMEEIRIEMSEIEDMGLKNKLEMPLNSMIKRTKIIRRELLKFNYKDVIKDLPQSLDVLIYYLKKVKKGLYEFEDKDIKKYLCGSIDSWIDNIELFKKELSEIEDKRLKRKLLGHLYEERIKAGWWTVLFWLGLTIMFMLLWEYFISIINFLRDL